MLNEYKDFAGLGVHWIMVGPSGRKTRPTEGGVLRHYKQCNKEPNYHVKTIINAFFVAGTTAHPHNFATRYELKPAE
jgi:hypothetical protein